MTHPLTKARTLGLLLVTLAFAAGVLVGVLVERRPAEGVQVTVVATDAIPRELESLGLSARQRETIQAILARGRPRVLRVLEAFEPRLQAAVDSTEAEVSAVLDATQRARWTSARARQLRRDTLIVRTPPRPR